VRSARAILDRHFVDPVGLVVTGLRDSSRYGYGAYAGDEPSLDVAITESSQSGTRRKLRL
jgi:hypothetical protein